MVALGPPRMASTVARFCVPATRRRYASSSRNSSGLEVMGAVTEEVIRLHAWPAGGPDQHLPEGWEMGRTIEGCTPDDVRTHDEQAGLRADEVVWQGVTYEVVSVAAWQGGMAQDSEVYRQIRAVQVTGRPEGT